MIIKLSHPILTTKLFKYVTISEIEIRRPVVGDLKNLNMANDKDTQESFKMMLSRISGLSIKDIEKLDLKDWMEITKIFNEMVSGKR